MRLLICDLGPGPDTSQEGGLRVALPAAQVERLVLPPRLVPIPHSPAWLSGYFDLEGRALAVVDLRALFGLSGLGERLYAHLVVLQEQPVALAVPKVLDSVEVAVDRLLPLPKTDSFQGLAAGVVRHDQDPPHSPPSNRGPMYGGGGSPPSRLPPRNGDQYTYIPLLVPSLLLTRIERERLDHFALLARERGT